MSLAYVLPEGQAGVYVFGGGIDEDVPPILVSADGAVAMGGYPWAPTLDGGFTVLELPSRDEAIAWAARINLRAYSPFQGDGNGSPDGVKR